MKHHITLLFDFDGTIADTFPVVIPIAQHLMQEFKNEPLSKKQLYELRTMTPTQIIARLKIPLYKVPFFLARGRAELRKNIEKVLPVSGIVSVLKKLDALGVDLFILTSNSEENVLVFLKKHKLLMFKGIYGGVTILGKNAAIRRFLYKEQLDKGDVFYIGDEVRDIEAARKAGVVSVAVSWGFNTDGILQQQQPDYLIHKPGELVNLVKKLF